jgi:hypothetical protein
VLSLREYWRLCEAPPRAGPRRALPTDADGRSVTSAHPVLRLPSPRRKPCLMTVASSFSSPQARRLFEDMPCSVCVLSLCSVQQGRRRGEARSRLVGAVLQLSTVCTAPDPGVTRCRSRSRATITVREACRAAPQRSCKEGRKTETRTAPRGSQRIKTPSRKYSGAGDRLSTGPSRLQRRTTCHTGVPGGRACAHRTRLAQEVIKACIRGSQKRDRGTACGALRRVSRGTQGTPRPVFEYGTQPASAGRALPLTPTAPRCTCRSGTGPCRAPHG